MTIAMALALWCVQDAAEELNTAGTKAQEWKSYAFKTTSTTEGMPQRQGGGGNNPGGPRTSEGEYIADSKLIHSKSGNFETIKKGDKTVTKGQDGSWTEPQQGGQGGRGRGRGMGNITPPHESLKDLGKAFQSVEKSTDGDLALYSGELTTEGATKLGGGGFGRGGNSTLETTGSAKVWVDSEGRIAKIEVNTVRKGDFNGTAVEIKTARTTEFSKFGEATFEIPEEAKKFFTD